MLGKLVRHLQRTGGSLLDAQIADIDRFFRGDLADASAETQRRYVRLLERIYDHLLRMRFVAHNPATDWVRGQGGLDRFRTHAGKTVASGVAVTSEDTGTISAADVSSLQDWLFHQGSDAFDRQDWRAARDITLASLSLGTGMRCAELQRLRRDQVKFTPTAPGAERFEFEIPSWASVVTARAHRTMADRRCEDLFTRWWQQRWIGFEDITPTRSLTGARGTSPAASAHRVLLPTGTVVFPATLTGKPLSPAALYRNLAELARIALKDRVLTPDTRWVLERGAQGLRRAFVLSALETGVEPALLTERLGHWHHRSIRRYSNGRPSRPSRGTLDDQSGD